MQLLEKFVYIVVICLGLTSTVVGEESKGTLKFDSTQPLEITSSDLVLEQSIGHATFTGDVIAKQGDLILTATKVLVEYLMENGEMTGEMKRLLASGGVTIINPLQAAEATEVVYDVAKDTIIMVGNVLVTERASATSGNKLTINLTTGSRRMEGNVRTIIISDKKSE
jgi:lipopolysaccharide export system protein LptA